MNRLQTEFQRLYPPQSGDEVRAMVLELARPASWAVLSKVWYGVQADLDLPAPGIAVSGSDGLQLWFSMEAPIAAVDAQAFMASLRSRYMAEVAASRIRITMNATAVPALHQPTGNWSAFVAPDLAPVFEDTPWLDLPPNEEGQASLLHGLKSIKQSALDSALDKLGHIADLAQPTPTSAHSVDEAQSRKPRSLSNESSADDDARRFLLGVMNDEAAPLAVRVDAAAALLHRR